MVLKSLRVAVVYVGVLLGERIVVELVGNAAVGAAVRHGRVMRADVGEVVVVRVVVALRERRIDAVERGDDVGFGLVEVADRRGVGVVFVEESAGRRRDRGGEQDEHMFDLHIRTRFRKLSLNRPNRCARGVASPVEARHHVAAFIRHLRVVTAVGGNGEEVVAADVDAARGDVQACWSSVWAACSRA